MGNTVIRHYGNGRGTIPHPVTSSQCRTTLHMDAVTCIECMGYLDIVMESLTDVVRKVDSPKFDQKLFMDQLLKYKTLFRSQDKHRL